MIRAKYLLTFLSLPLLLAGCNSKEKESTCNIGDWTGAGDYKVRVVSVENTQLIPSYSNFTTQNNFACILVELKNEASISHRYSFDDFKVYSGSNKYESKGTEAWWYAESKKDYPSVYLSDSIDPSLSGKYYLVFEIPTPTTEGDYRLEYSYAFETAKINLK